MVSVFILKKSHEICLEKVKKALPPSLDPRGWGVDFVVSYHTLKEAIGYSANARLEQG